MASNPTIDSFTADIQSLRQELRGLKDDLAGLAGGGASSGSMMPSSLGRVSSNAFGGFDTSNPISGMMTGGAVRSLFGRALSGGGLALAGTGVLTSLMPSMEKYAVRESGYYMAGMYSMGTSGREDLKNRTLGRLSALGGVTSVGADATVSAILSGRGVNTSSPYYNTLISQIGNVGRYMNMENEVAAQSMANLTGGRTSASLLQRGIFTSNPLTGQSMKESDIFEQFARRTIVGDLSVAETQDELRRGFLGANIESLDIDAAAKERLKMYLIARAGGKTLDFTSEKSMSDAFGPGGALETYTNPFADIYKINAAETGSLEQFGPSYTKGLANAAGALETLYQNVSKTASEFGELNAFLSTLLGNDLGANLGNPVSAAALMSVNAMGAAGTAFDAEGFGAALGAVALSMLNPFNFMGVDSGNAGGGGGMFDTDLGGNLGLPVSDAGSVSAGYGKPGTQFWDGTHNGIDYGVGVGTPVYAAADGYVEEARQSSLTKGYGKYIRLRHSNGYDTIYAHLSEFLVSEGDRVAKGQQIGLSGSTGTAEPHLHFEVQNSETGKDLRPSLFPTSGGSGGGSLLSGSGAGLSGGPVGGGSSLSNYASLLLPSSGSSSASGTTLVSRGSNSVTIHLNIASASEAEAMRFAELVKQKLEEDSFMSQMGAR
jgi:murein DD-endopeptidase MepM/ murein hydrolase activator NlpD